MSDVAVVLMAYGSPDRIEDVPAYYADIRGGRPIAPEHLEDLVARYRALGIEDALRLEYRMVHRVLAGHEFPEGVRALLIDKDRQPRWRPATLAEVDKAAVEAHFAPLPDGDLPFDWDGV